MRRFIHSNHFFPVVGLVLILQLLFRLLIEEPYPSIILPLFAKAPTKDNRISIHFLDGKMIVNSDTIAITYNELLPQVRPVLRELVLNRTFGKLQEENAGTIPEPLSNLIQENVKQLLTDSSGGQLLIDWNHRIIDVATNSTIEEKVQIRYQIDL